MAEDALVRLQDVEDLVRSEFSQFSGVRRRSALDAVAALPVVRGTGSPDQRLREAAQNLEQAVRYQAAAGNLPAHLHPDGPGCHERDPFGPVGKYLGDLRAALAALDTPTYDGSQDDTEDDLPELSGDGPSVGRDGSVDSGVRVLPGSRDAVAPAPTCAKCNDTGSVRVHGAEDYGVSFESEDCDCADTPEDPNQEWRAFKGGEFTRVGVTEWSRDRNEAVEFLRAHGDGYFIEVRDCGETPIALQGKEELS